VRVCAGGTPPHHWQIRKGGRSLCRNAGPSTGLGYFQSLGKSGGHHSGMNGSPLCSNPPALGYGGRGASGSKPTRLKVKPFHIRTIIFSRARSAAAPAWPASAKLLKASRGGHLCHCSRAGDFFTVRVAVVNARSSQPNMTPIGLAGARRRTRLFAAHMSPFDPKR
jgi:hypothetical protein